MRNDTHRKQQSLRLIIRFSIVIAILGCLTLLIYELFRGDINSGITTSRLLTSTVYDRVAIGSSSKVITDQIGMPVYGGSINKFTLYKQLVLAIEGTCNNADARLRTIQWIDDNTYLLVYVDENDTCVGKIYGVYIRTKH